MKVNGKVGLVVHVIWWKLCLRLLTPLSSNQGRHISTLLKYKQKDALV